MHHDLAEWLKTHSVTYSGCGPGSWGTLEAINLACTGKATNDLPDCMCPVLYGAVMVWQNSLPWDVINTPEWTAIVIRLADSRSTPEAECRREEMVLDHMWTVVLPQLHPLADARGFGAEWRAMCERRNVQAASAAARAAEARAAARAARAAWAAAEAMLAGREAPWPPAAWAAEATTEAARAVAALAARRKGSAEMWAARAAFWASVNIPGLLSDLLDVGPRPGQTGSREKGKEP